MQAARPQRAAAAARLVACSLVIVPNSVVLRSISGDNELPSWSQNGEIAFASNRSGRFQIYMMSAAGSRVCV
jgi:WD40-like Beta Propeller Repeat